VAHADGSVIHTRVAPRRATGPDVARLYIGSRGALGVITTAVLKVHRQPEHEAVVACALPSLPQAVEVARRCLAHGIRPALLRALGEEQAAEELGDSGTPLPAVLLVVLSGPAAMVAEEQRLLGRIVADAEGTELPGSLGSRWRARHSVAGEPLVPAEGPVGTRVAHSKMSEALASLPRRVQRRRVQLWVDQISPQGATLWLTCKGSSKSQAALRSALLDAGLDPLRLDFPPLMEELRQKLDPTETLVVMEA
jgi:FAD/FMN-containing dehydrogenase